MHIIETGEVAETLDNFGTSNKLATKWCILFQLFTDASKCLNKQFWSKTSKNNHFVEYQMANDTGAICWNHSQHQHALTPIYHLLKVNQSSPSWSWQVRDGDLNQHINFHCFLCSVILSLQFQNLIMKCLLVSQHRGYCPTLPEWSRKEISKDSLWFVRVRSSDG